MVVIFFALLLMFLGWLVVWAYKLNTADVKASQLAYEASYQAWQQASQTSLPTTWITTTAGFDALMGLPKDHLLLRALTGFAVDACLHDPLAGKQLLLRLLTEPGLSRGDLLEITRARHGGGDVLAASWPGEDLWLAVNPATEDGLALPPDVVRALAGYVQGPEEDG